MELSFNRINYFEYEKSMILKHQKEFNHITYHWNNVPEDILFESGFIQDYHQHRMKYKNNYLETGTYHNLYEELGLDGIAQERDGLYHGIQCKLYDAKVSANDLGSFYHVLFMRMKRINPLSKGYLYHSSELQKSIKDDFLKEGSIISCKVPFIQENKEKEETIQLRYYQKDALKALSEDWGCNTGSMVSPCGTGKTVIFNQHIVDMDYKNVFILSLYKIHALQNLNVSKEYHKNNYEYLLVDSDTAKSGATRDIEIIKEKLNKKCIFSITYQSAEDLLSQFFEEEDCDDEDMEDGTNEVEECKKLVPKFDLSNSLVIVDEAHNLIHREKLIKILNAFPKTLLVTATPSDKMDEIIGSKLIYEYKFEKAIEDKYICDYQIYLPYIENKVDEIPEELKNIDNDLCKKVLFFVNGLLKSGSRRSIIYLQSKKECVLFENVFKEVMDKYHYRKYMIYNINCDVDYETRNKILNDFSKKSNDDGIKIITSINILNECVDIPKCDSVFIANMSEKANYIKTIQRIFRANRIDVTNPNKIANCFIWSEDMDGIMESLQILKSNDIQFSNKIKVMNGNYEKNGDIKMKEKIIKANMEIMNYVDVKCMTFTELNEFKKKLLFEYCNKLNSVDEFKNIGNIRINGINITRRYQLHLYNITSKDNFRYKEYSECKILKEHMDIYLENKENTLFTTEDKKKLLFEYCNNEKKVPLSIFIYKGCNIGEFYINIKKPIKSNLDLKYIDFSINEYIKTDIDNMIKKRETKYKPEEFELMANKLFEYCDKYGFPTNSGDQRLYKWICAQRNRLRDDEVGKYKYQYLSKNILVKDYLDEKINQNNNNLEMNFVKKCDEWMLSFNKVKDFVNKYKRIPKRSKESDKEEFKLASWVSRIKSEKDKLSDERIKLLESLDNWVWSSKKFL